MIRWSLVLMLMLGVRALAQEDAATAERATEVTEGEIPLRSGEASIGVEGRRLSYTWEAGTLPVLDDETGALRAHLFHVAYRVPVDNDAPARPVTFVFNGGPGSSSVWLHMGILGPRRIAFANERGDAPAPPYDIVDNAWTWLTFSDLVFIDPISTGFSRPAEDVERSEFHGLEQDVSSVGDFIRLWTSRNDAWDAPKYLCGESYGTTRAAGLSRYLQDRHAMYLNGVVMVSSALDFMTLRFGEGNILPPTLFLPTYTATAHYHGVLEESLQALPLANVLAEVERFVIEDYTPALMLGDRLTGERERRVVRALARFTGTSEAFIRRTDLQPSIWRFTKELLRDRARVVGRLDSRFAGIDDDPSADSPTGDPSYDLILGPYAGAVNAYLGEELGLDEDRVYEILTSKVRPWDFGSAGQNRFVNVAPRLREAMQQNPHLRVLFQSGYYDLATPYFATDHVIAQLRLDPAIRSNVVHTVYPAGHMMYLHLPTLEAQTIEARNFYQLGSEE